MGHDFDNNGEAKRLARFTVYVESDYDAMSERAARLYAAEISAKPRGVFGFATGSTPVGMYKSLIKLHCSEGLDFSGLTTFNLDEYYPIRRDNSQSYIRFMHENLFDHVNINPESINIPNGEAEDGEAECRRYSDRIAASGGIDMQLLGIGTNGHIGFNEPDEIFPGDTHVVRLKESTITANARFFESAADVPVSAITMGVREIMLARRILFTASGSGKAEIIREALTGPITPNVPASVLQLHRHVTVVLDRDAAASIIDRLSNK